MDSILFTKIKEKIAERKMQLTTLKVESVAEPEKARLNGNQRLQEALFIVGLLATIFITMSIFSFDPADPSWTQTSWAGTVQNAGGSFGAWIADTLFFVFGSLAYLLPVVLLGCTWIAFRKKDEDQDKELDLMMIGTRILGLLILFLTSCALADINFDDLWYFSSGGVVGDVLTSITTPVLNLLGSTLIFMFLWGAGFTLFTGVSWLTIVDNLGDFTLETVRKLVNKLRKTEDETYQVEHKSVSSDPATSFETVVSEHQDIAVDIDVDPFATPKISSRELSMFANSPNAAKESHINTFEANEHYDNDPLFSMSSLDTVEPQVTEPQLNQFAPIQEDPLVEIRDQSEVINKPTVSELLKEIDEPEELEDGLDLAMRSNATISELDTEALDQDPLLNQIDAEQAFVHTSTIATVAVGAEDIGIIDLPEFEAPLETTLEAQNLESLSAQYNEQQNDQYEDLGSDILSEDTLPSIGDEEKAYLSPELESLTESSEQEMAIQSTEEPILPTFNAIEETVELADAEELHMSAVDVSFEDDETAQDIKEIPLNREVVIEEVFAEDEPTHSDADIAAFQALVAKEKATQAALQNPFLVNSEPNLPKPTSPMPTLELLYSPNTRAEMESRESLEHTARLVEAKLADYKIKARVVDIFPGPVITRFELDLAPGVKVSRISGLATDLARSLSAMAVRVVEVIPGKPYVGLELPNFNRQTVFFSDVVGSEIFQNAKSPTTVVMGLDIAGEAVIADLAKMPHVLVAGTTGSGKSVGVNVMILSVLYKATPEDVRFIMIDPKMLELSIYEGIPHLLTEVVTDMKDAGNALRWCVGEMERRYKLMSALGVRNLQGFNDKLKMAAAAGHPIHDPLWKPGDSMDEMPPLLEKLPSIIVIVDEFADLMMVVGKKVEELIARLAQKARAAGIHLILATQRPSVDVITGLIKANIPTRVAFTVSTKVDSRTILDQGGAESLLGMGDMLYLAPGSNHTVRVHGAFASDDDVHAVVNDWKARGRPNYIEAITKSEQGAESLLPGEKSDSEEELDQLFDQVVEFVTTSRRGSVSGVQRQFRIGYNRAARIVEQLEAHGIVSTPGHNGNREVIAPPPVGSGD